MGFPLKLFCIIFGIIINFPKFSLELSKNEDNACQGGDNAEDNFGWKGNVLNCSPDSIHSVNISLKTDHKIGPTGGKIDSDGTLFVKNGEGLYFFKKKDYCVLWTSTDVKTVAYCKPSQNCFFENENCFEKCCPPGKVLEFDTIVNSLRCQSEIEEKRNLPWNVVLNINKPIVVQFPNISKNSRNPKSRKSAFFSMQRSYSSYIKYLPDFKGSYHKRLIELNFYLIDNRQIASCPYAMWHVFGLKNKFCIDAIQNFGNQSGNLTTFAILIDNSTDNVQNTIMVSDMDLPADTKKAVDNFLIIYYISAPISVYFLLMIIIIYGLLWQNHKNIHRLTTISYIVTLLLAYVSWLIIPLEGTLRDEDYPIQHHISAFFAYSSICWLTMIDVDIWITFRNLKLPASKHLRRYFMYAAFAWNIPLLLVLLAICLETSKSERCTPPNSNDLPPKLSLFIDRMFHQFLITGTLLALNFMLFALTMYHMWQQNKMTSSDLQDSTHTHKKNSMLWLCAKIFIVMGGAWILDTVPLIGLYYFSWHGKQHTALEVGKDVHDFLLKLIYCQWFTQLMSVVESFTLFYILVCKQAIFTKLWENYPKLRGILPLFGKVCGYRQPTPLNQQDLTVKPNLRYSVTRK